MVARNVAQEPLLTEVQTAEFLGVKPQTLACWRCTKRYGLRYVKVGRAIRYMQSDVSQFLADRTVDNAAIAASQSITK